MFKPLRLVYLEATPEKGPEALTTKNFLGELKKFGYDKEKAKEAVREGALKEKGGYRLTKAEALVAAGKITTLADLDNAAAYALNVGDIDDFLNLYGGDKYVKRLFTYGTNKMERDFMAKKQNFEADKKKGGTFEGLKQYATFEEAFSAGFYKDMVVDFDSIMEKGLSVSEYRQRDERFRKLEKKVKKMDKEPEYPEGELPGVGQKVEEKKVEAPQPKGDLKKSPTESLQTIERTPPKPPEVERTEKDRKFEIALNKLGDLGEAFRKSDEFVLNTLKKYSITEEDRRVFEGFGFGNYTPLADPADKDAYIKKFFAMTRNPVTGKSFRDYKNDPGSTLGTFLLNKEVIEESIGKYEELTAEKEEKLKSFKRALYTKANGGQSAEGTKDEAIRAEEMVAAEKAIPEITQVGGHINAIKMAVAQWRLTAHDIVLE